MPTPMSNLIQGFGNNAQLAGYPRSESEYEVMTERSKERAAGTRPKVRSLNQGSLTRNGRRGRQM